METEIIKQLKLLKGIEDNLQDDLLNLIIKQSKQAILSRLNRLRKETLSDVPKELDWVILEVSAKRFNRLDSEGTTKHEREGESFTWDGLLDEYELDFEKYYDNEDDLSRKGILRVW